MSLTFYIAVDEEYKDTFIIVNAIESVEVRERFWPTGEQKQDIVKELFSPYKDLAKELASYLVEDAYLKPESGCGGAIFKSLERMDYFLQIKFRKRRINQYIIIVSLQSKSLEDFEDFALYLLSI